MSTIIDTMRARPDAALAARLEKLSAEGAVCCDVDLPAAARVESARPGFRDRLAQLKALADERRLLAARLIQAHGELCSCEVQAALGVTHATVSHHMRALEEAGLVASERRGKWVYYRLASKDVAELLG